MKARVRTLSSRTIYKGKIVTLKVDRVLEPGKITATREIVQHPGSVVVLPRLEDGGVLLVRQFRYATCQAWRIIPALPAPWPGVEHGGLTFELGRRFGVSL